MAIVLSTEAIILSALVVFAGTVALENMCRFPCSLRSLAFSHGLWEVVVEKNVNLLGVLWVQKKMGIKELGPLSTHFFCDHALW